MEQEKNSIKNNIKNSKDIINYIKKNTFNSKDIVYKKLDVEGEEVDIVYNESLCDENAISNFIIRSIGNLVSQSLNEKIVNEISNENKTLNENLKNSDENTKNKEKANKKVSLKERVDDRKNFNATQKIDINVILEKLQKNITIGKSKKIDIETDDIFYYLFSGFTFIIYDTTIIAFGTGALLDRSISEPTSEKNIKGPKDSFIENYQINVGLIRKRIKTEKLVLNESQVGRRSKTKIGILYIQDICRKDFVDSIIKQIEKIDIDAIIDSNYIMEILEDSNKTDFPTMISTERPDLVSFYLLQGRVALVIENTPFVLVIPAFITDFVNNIEDNYQKDINVFITKLVRYLAFVITIFTPAFYVALVAFGQESIPTKLLLSFATQREGVTFPAYLEAFLMILSFEILREGDFRVPNSGGSTLSIVGALILGDAAVNAGIVSPIMIIVIAITTISGLMFTDINMANALRKWRVILLIFASAAGLVGLGVGMILLIINLASTTSLKKPYTYPIAPLNVDALKKNFLRRKNISLDNKRQKILTDNLTKYRIDKEKS